MRVALLLSGQMRTFDDDDVLKKYHDNLINPLNADVFVSTWDTRGCSYNHGATPDTTVLKKSTELITHQLLSEAYKSRLISSDISIVEEYEQTMPAELQPIYKNGFTWCGLKIRGTSVPQFYQIQRANQLKLDYEKANNFKYDLVIRSRPDNIMVRPLDPRYLTNLSQNIYGINCTGTYHPKRIYDIFFYSDSKNMDSMATAYNNMVSLEHDPFENGLDHRDACRLLYVHAKRHNLNVVDMDYNPCYIKR
jgi:hypothetical protein